MARLTSYGAAGEVTGSKHLLEAAGKKILLDCGMFQGSHTDRERNSQLLFDAKSIDAVILSHGHLDHCGSLPTLVRDGFRGVIYATPATRDVAELIMRDSAHIQEQDAEYMNRHLRPGQAPLVPVYTHEEVDRVVPLFSPLSYGETKEIVPGIKITLLNAGHILGSSLVSLLIDESAHGGQITRLGYTGDLGQRHIPILRDPDTLGPTDTLLIESTYGDRVHDSMADTEERLIALIATAIKTGGKIIVPSFALGRTQTLIYTLHKLTDAKRIPRIPTYVDSPLGVHLTEVFSNHPECFDEETAALFTNRHEDPFGFQNLTFVSSVEDSRALNSMPGPAIIIASAGMMDAGRILHHLKNGIGDPKNTILIVGYQGRGTLGRAVLEGAKGVRLFHEWHEVQAQVTKMNAFSAHADQAELVDFVARTPELKRVIIVHGENNAREGLAQVLKEKLPHLQIALLQDGETVSCEA